MSKIPFHLSDRLRCVAGMVSPGAVTADIGTDHGYIPVYLVAGQICPRAIAMDINDGPLRHARRTVQSCGLEQLVELRLSDGLEKLRPNEADTVVIAGMGGALTVRILQAYPEVTKTVKELVLAPQSEVAGVRRWIRENGFTITDENMVREDGKYYPVIQAERTDIRGGSYKCTEKAAAEESFCRQPDELSADLYGPVLLRKKHPVLRDYLQYSLRIRHEILESLSNGRADHPRIKEIQNEINRIQKVLAYLQAPERSDC